jgi:hypothetical protein
LSVPGSSHSRGTRPALASPNHTANVATATATTKGAKTEATLSANCCTGAFDICASVMSSMICASAVSEPTRSARTCTRPSCATVDAKTSEPAALCTGMGSPVSIDSSISVTPHTTVPSVGTTEPGTTFSTSPGCTSAASISRAPSTSPCAPSVSSVAVRGCMRMSFVSASVVFPVAIASSILPNVTNVSSIAELSKNVWPRYAGCVSAIVHEMSEYKYDAVVPRHTRKSIPTLPWCSPFHAAT